MSPTPPGANIANSTQVSSGKGGGGHHLMQRQSHDFSHLLLLLEGGQLVEQWVGEHLQQSLVLREKYNKYKQIQQIQTSTANTNKYSKKSKKRKHFQKSLVLLETSNYWDFHFEGFLTNIDQITNI